MTDFDTFTPPVITDGDMFRPHENIGHTLIVKVLELKHGVVTPNTPQGGPAVIVDLVDLDSPGAPAIYRDVLWMGGAFVDGLKELAPGGTKHTGRPVVIGIESRTGKSGRAYAAPVAADAPALGRAGAYYQAHGDPFAPTFDTTGDRPPF